MDAFVRRLVEYLFDPRHPLSRNRHFHTFDNPEGQKALRISRRLEALKRDIVTAVEAGRRVSWKRGHNGVPQIEFMIEKLNGTRRSTLDEAEFEILCALPGVREAL